MTVTVAGIGYGADTTAEVAAALAEADVVIGHDFFTSSVRGLVRPDAECFDVLDRATADEDVFAVRSRIAAERSAAGARVVIVSGGDPGLLGMAGPVLHWFGRFAPDRVAEVRVLPGLSAWQYAGAALGAPFNGGAAVLSLCLYSHTEQRIRAQIEGVAASGLGAVVYMLRHNGEEHPELFPTDEPPADLARRRFELLRDALLRHRDPGSPVFLLTGIGRTGGPAAESAALKDALGLWERSGPESVLCVPGAEFEQEGERLWAMT